MTTRALAAAILAVSGSLAGCAHSGATRAAPDAPSVAGGVFGHRLEPVGAIEAQDLRPGSPGVERWTSVEGLLAPGGFEIVTSPASPGADAWTTRTADLETARWSQTSEGSLQLESVDSHPDDARSLFEPPLLLAPGSLPAGRVIEAESTMRVVRLPGGTSERDHGVGRRAVRYARDEWIRLDGTDVRAQVAEVVFVADLRNARAERTSELFVVPGRGTVGERWREELVILRVFTKRSGQFALREGAEIAPAASETEPAPNAALQ